MARHRGIKQLEPVNDMTSRIIGALFGALLGMGASAAFAQSETECVSAKTDWSVCVWQQPKECWGVSKPKETVNSKDGKVVSAGRAACTTTYWVEDKGTNYCITLS